MFDQPIRKKIDPLLTQIAQQAHLAGITANRMSIAGFILGIGAGGCVMLGEYGVGLIFFALNRLADGLDGHIARLSHPTDFGGYLDIVCDFIFYAFIPLSFAIAIPEAALAAAFLIFSFIGTASSFLAYAILQAKHPEKAERAASPKKSFYYIGGLTEGTETILALGLCFLFPAFFIWVAYGFGILCLITCGTRIAQAWHDFGKES